MSDIRDTYDKIDASLKPHWDALVRAANGYGLMITGFIWGDPVPEDDNPYLVRFGNVQTNTPQEMFAINYQLAVMAARLESEGRMERNMTDSGASPEISGLDDPSPLAIADNLALTLLVAPPESIPTEVLEILSQYIKMRRPPVPESGK
jgi:hypothetical protein